MTSKPRKQSPESQAGDESRSSSNQGITVVIAVPKPVDVDRPTPHQADFVRWSSELEVTLFQGAMLMVGLEPFREIFLAGYSVPFLVDCMPLEKRSEFETIYNRSKAYWKNDLLPGYARQSPPAYPLIYVKLTDYVAWADTQAFQVPPALYPFKPSQGMYRRDRTLIDSKHAVKRGEFIETNTSRMQGGKKALQQFFDGKKKTKGEVREADQFRLFNQAGMLLKGYYDRVSMEVYLASRLTARLATKRTRQGGSFSDDD